MESNQSTKRQIMLVLRAQAGDRDALNRLLASCQQELFAFLVNMLRDRNDAEDVLQTTLLQVAKKLKWLRAPKQFRAWIFRIASRQAFKIIKSRQRSNALTNAEFIDQVLQPMTETTVHQDLIDRIPEWLQRLSPRGREAVSLHYLSGFTTEEVADILGIPLGTAKSRISYSLACIRKHVYFSINER